MPLRTNIAGMDSLYVFTDKLKKQKRDAVRIMKLILVDNEIGKEMKKKVIDTMLWNISGLGEGSFGKYLIRFRSKKSLDNQDARIIHEHVYPKKYLIEKIMNENNPDDETIDKIFGCIVTEDEHRELHKKEHKNLIGWERYKAAGIEVQDMIDNSPYKFPKQKE